MTTDWVSIIVYIVLFIILPLNIYLKKTGKTFKEMVQDIINFFKELEL